MKTETIEALEYLPALERSERAGKVAQESHQKDSAARALAAARDYRDTCRDNRGEGLASDLKEAHAELLIAIAERRMGAMRSAQASYARCRALIAPALDSPPFTKRARELQQELFLEQAIHAFVSDDFLESARLNERAARLAGQSAAASRAWLNAAISWDRLSETRETRRCLDLGGQLLKTLPWSALHDSYSLFEWRMSLDRGPLLKTPTLSSQATRSQHTLHSLYHWEYQLLTGTTEAATQARRHFEAWTLEHREFQFAREQKLLLEAEQFLHSGKVPKLEKGSLTVARLRSMLASKEPRSEVILWVIGLLVRLLTSGSKKNLEIMADCATRDSRPVIQAWGHRAKFWIACRSHDPSRALESHAQALRLAEDNHLSRLKTLLICEKNAFELREGSRAPLKDASPAEARGWEAFLKLLPGGHGQVMVLQPSGRHQKDEAQALAELDAHSSEDLLIVDGVRGHVLAFGKELKLDRMPIQKRLLLALVGCYPGALTKSELVSQVWEELYNPLVHDAVLYRSVSRLRSALSQSAPRGRSKTRSGERPGILLDARGIRLSIDRRRLWAVLPESIADRQGKSLNERQIRILTLLKYRGQVSRGETVRALQAPLRTVARDLTALVDRKLILRTGRGPSTLYQPAI